MDFRARRGPRGRKERLGPKVLPGLPGLRDLKALRAAPKDPKGPRDPKGSPVSMV